MKTLLILIGIVSVPTMIIGIAIYTAVRLINEQPYLGTPDVSGVSQRQMN